MPTKNHVKYELDVELQFATPALEDKWGSHLPKRLLKKWIKAAVKQDAKFLVRLVGSAESKKLNAEYRGQDHATNILTFTLHDPIIDNFLIADLVICIPVVEREAKEQGKNALDHFIHLIIHGVLHAQGFDHEDEIDAMAMESLEIAILKNLKIKNPYQ
jgi:probable rRNA maturation factor